MYLRDIFDIVYLYQKEIQVRSTKTSHIRYMITLIFALILNECGQSKNKISLPVQPEKVGDFFNLETRFRAVQFLVITLASLLLVGMMFLLVCKVRKFKGKKGVAR